MRGRFLLAAVALFAFGGATAQSGDDPAPALLIAEIVADPQTDWNADGSVTASDEYVEIVNVGPAAVDLANWSLEILDTTPETARLIGDIAPGARLLVLNPPGAINNDATLRLRAPTGAVLDEVSYGDNDTSGVVPDANAQGVLDEALALVDGIWTKRHATPWLENQATLVRLTDDFERVGDARWSDENATHRLEFRLVNAARNITGVALDGTDLRVAFPPTHTANASLDWTVSGGDHVPINISIEVDGATEGRPLGVVHVDRDAPTIPELPAGLFTNQTSATVAWTPSHDDGVGNVGYRLEVANDATFVNASEVGPLQESLWTLENLSHGRRLSIRVLAEDGYGHRSNWSAPMAVLADFKAPSAPSDVSVAGYDGTRLLWSASWDNTSGIAGYQIVRVWQGEEEGFVIGNVTSWEDPDAPRTGPLIYRVGAFDGAGNPSPDAIAEAHHEALHPHVEGIRVKKPLWSSGVQELRIDFDRPMNLSVPARVEVDGDRIAGGWLSNASTLFIAWDGPMGFADGNHSVDILDAVAPDGHGLWATARSGFVLDTAAPTSRYVAEGNRLEATDAIDPAPAVFFKSWREGADAPPVYVRLQAGQQDLSTLGPGSWWVRFYASDAAGNHEAPKQTLVRVLFPAPEDPKAPTTPTTAESPVDAAPALDPPPSDAATGSLLLDLEAIHAEVLAQDPPAEGSTWPAWAWGAAALGASGSVLALRERAFRRTVRTRRSRRPASFAERLRRHIAKAVAPSKP